MRTKMNDSAEKNYKSNNSPKRRKLSTINYIHKSLFEEGHESDIKIVALNREWNLHKNILSQSPYFKSMFSGSWVEKELKEINLGIEDVNITAEALHKVFESLYSDEIQVEPTEAVPILACATFLQLDDLINHCAEVMKVCINQDTAVRFFEAAELYSIEDVKIVAFEWLCRNAVRIFYSSPQQIFVFGEDLMKKLFISPDLCVRDEYQVLSMLHRWMFLKKNPHYDNWKELRNRLIQFEDELYLKEKPFLETDFGISYQSLCSAIRINNLITDDLAVDDITKGDIFIPAEWYMPAIKTQWCHMLRIHKGLDKGPKSVSKEVFNRECVRVSGSIKNYTSWRYKDFDFGFGLAFCYENGSFRIDRDISSNNSVGPAFSYSGKRYIMYKVSLFSEDSDGRILSKAETGIKTVSMVPNDEIVVLTFSPLTDSVFRYRINFLLTTP